MSGPTNRQKLATEPDFELGALKVSPSSCRVLANGAEVRVEAQTMAVLVVLAKASGATVSRDDLVAACWEGRIVSDDAIARTVAKARALARSVAPPAFVIETVPKIGYRLQIETNIETNPGAGAETFKWPALPKQLWRPVALGALLAGLASPLVWGAFANITHPPLSVGWTVASPTSVEVLDALLTLDEQRVQLYLQRGWDPNWHLDSERNAALHNLMMACERNPSHDQAGVVRIAQLLVASGADPTIENKWGDTPLIIARTPRYCGPDHPVVAYLQGLEAR